MKYLGIILALFSNVARATPEDCCIPSQEKTRLLQLAFNDFDQDLTHSWRLWANSGCYDVSIDLIESYEKLHDSILNYSQKNVLVWHTGQLYGAKNDSVNARAHFVASLNPNEPVDSPVLWNDYVIGSIAFLDHDLEIIKAHRNKIANGPIFGGKRPNLNVMDNFITYFDQPYSVAYNDGNPSPKPKSCKLPTAP